MKNIFKFMKNTKFRSFSLFAFLLFLYVFISAQGYVTAVSNNLSDAVFRLHVLANSDSTEDQELKLKVRDGLLNYMNDICSNCSTKEEAISLAIAHTENFQNIAEQIVLENGYNYPVKININNFYFPTKNYGDISLPAGFYDALRVEIGEAKGQNWWCVMFPPLCFVDVSSGIVPEDSKETMKNNLSQEEYSLISQSDTDFKFKFKIVEVLQNFSISGIFM